MGTDCVEPIKLVPNMQGVHSLPPADPSDLRLLVARHRRFKDIFSRKKGEHSL
jgi:hypothetical protein